MGITFNPDFQHFDPTSSSRQVLGTAARTYGRKRAISKNFELPLLALEAGDIIVLCPIPSSAVIHTLGIVNDALDGVATLTMDIGLCDKFGADINPGAGDSRDMFEEDTAAFQAAVLPDAELEYIRGVVTTAQNVPEAHGAAMFERVNLQSAAAFVADPAREWFVCLRAVLAPATDQGGTLGFRVEYTLD